MKDWKNIVPDETRLMQKHYTPGRGGSKITKIVVHHNGGNLSIKGCWNVWQTRQASAHYQVDASGRIGRLVNDADTAWHAGNWAANVSSIGIEHADISATDYRLTAATLDAGAHLVAALCLKYGLGRPQWMKNVYPHYAFSSTECPASIAGSQNTAYMAAARKHYDQMVGNPTKTDEIESMVNSMKATHIIFQYGNALGIANVLANKYHLYTRSQDYKDNVYALNQAGAKVTTWGALRKKTGKDANKVANLAAFGIPE